VVGWRDRYETGGIRALEDMPRSGRPPEIDEIDVVVATLPMTAGRRASGCDALVGAVAGRRVEDRVRDGGSDLAQMESATVAGADLQIQYRPELDSKIRDVVGLYLHPPEKAVVLCIDEKSQVQPWTGPPRSCRSCPVFRAPDP